MEVAIGTKLDLIAVHVFFLGRKITLAIISPKKISPFSSDKPNLRLERLLFVLVIYLIGKINLKILQDAPKTKLTVAS